MQSAGDKAEADLKSAGDDVKDTAKNLESGARDKAADFRSDAKSNASQAQSEAKGYVQSATDAVKVQFQHLPCKTPENHGMCLHQEEYMWFPSCLLQTTAHHPVQVPDSLLKNLAWRQS